ncbi:MAG: hypothetical protein Kow0099_33180 [Candidatus Abyssubacteria bacterium]
MEKTEIYTEVLPDSPEREKVFKRCRPAERLILAPERDSDAGKCAIKVKRRSGELLGYLEEGVCERVAPREEEIETADTMVLLVTGGGFFNRAPRHCYIKITL